MKRNVLVTLFVIVAVILGACQVLPGGNGGDDGVVEATADVNEQPRSSDVTVAPTFTPIPFTQVVVAVQNIPRGIIIEPNLVTTIRFPAESIPSGAFAEIDDVVGLIAATDIFSEELIIARKLVQDFSSLGRVGSDAAAILDPGRVAIAVPMDRITSVAYALQPGDRVDVIVSMLFVDIDQDFQTILPNTMITGSYFTGLETDAESGTTTATTELVQPENIPNFSFRADEFDSRTMVGSDAISITGQQSITTRDDLIIPVIIEPSEQQRPRLVTQRTVTDAQIVWVGEFPRDGRIFAPAPTPTQVTTPDPNATEAVDGTEVAATPIPDRPTIVTVAVRPQDAVVLTYMAEAGIPMTFALRSARTQGLPDTSPVTLNYILQTYNIQVPESLNFGIEPAIRSIRGITLQNIFASGSATDNTNADATEEPAAEGN